MAYHFIRINEYINGHFMTDTIQTLRVAIVGSGPAGLFAADELLRRRPGTRIDILERLPAAGGLVRYAVAPDHPVTRRVLKLFDLTLAKPGVTLRTGVEVGRDVSVAGLRAQYDAVVVATGAEADRPLGIPGESLPNVIPSTAFCGWVNGDPDFADLDIDLSVDTAVVIGNGNVALDCARLLARTQAALASTDMAPAALARFAMRAIRRIVVLGRRGPAQNSFGAAEIAEFGTLENCALSVSPAGFPIVGNPEDRLFQSLETLKSFAERGAAVEPSGEDALTGGLPRTEIAFHFFSRPVEIVSQPGRSVLRVERTRLDGDRAAGTGAFEEIPCGLVIKAVGHRGVALPGLPFDEARGVIPNEAGRIERGLYCTGWIKRGASGLIGNNRKDAMETVASLLADHPAPV